MKLGDENDAAAKAWDHLSKNFTSSIPEFAFTIRDDNNNYHSYYVVEKPSGKFADYTITKLNNVLTSLQQKALEDEHRVVEEKAAELIGGRKRYEKYDDDTSDSSDSSDSDGGDNFVDTVQNFAKTNSDKYNKPIVYWWYAPQIYRVNRFYVPSLVAPLTPYIEINLSSAFLG